MTLTATVLSLRGSRHLGLDVIVAVLVTTGGQFWYCALTAIAT